MGKKIQDNTSTTWVKPKNKGLAKKEIKKKSKFFIILILLAAIIALLFFSTRIYLAVNLLLGNDIVVKFSADNDNINLKHGESKNIGFEAYILTNPLCSAECSIKFEDLSSGKIIDTESFILKPAITKAKEYSLTADKTGKGQDLYRFNIKCTGVKTFWCHTSEINRTRSAIITVNYDLNDDEKELKNSSKLKIEKIIQNTNSINARIESLDLTISNLSSIGPSIFKKELNEIKILEEEYNYSAFNLKKEWENQNYDLFPPKNAIYEIVPSGLELKLDELNSSLSQNISLYNQLIDNLTVLRQNLEQLNSLNLSNESLIQRDNAIILFNNAIDSFNNLSSVNEKESIVSNISLPLLANEENESNILNELIYQVPSKLQIINIQPIQIGIIFKEPLSRCCLFGKCDACCENCPDNNYPVLFIHGHSFNQGISAEYSLETFQEMQQRLEEDSYLNAGSILIGEQNKIWSLFNSPLTVRASYYFDLYKNPAESSIIQTKSDSLDTYALRLRDIITTAKTKTGKNKVILVAHSMGGLVARQYINIFGSDSIDRLILIGTPNNGIDSNIQKFCTIIGESLECRDMAKDSLFINKLNYEPLPNMPIYNIIGTGCKMSNETGDGIVLKSSAYLKGAKNYEINGTCNDLKFEFLHSEMIYPEKYPEVYKIVLQSLKQ